jgi:uncharacterized small protein (DUF1192 family)
VQTTRSEPQPAARKADSLVKQAKPGKPEAGSGDGTGDGAAKTSKRRDDKKVRALQKSVAELETRIAALEEQQAQRSAELSKPETYADSARYGVLLAEYQADAAKLEDLLGRWERAQAEMAQE